MVSLVCAVLGVATSWFYGLGAIFGVAAIVLAWFALRGDPPRDPARALASGGIITGAIAVGLAIGLLLFGLVVSNAFDTISTDSNSDLDDSLGFNTDPSDGECDVERFMQDPDC